MDDWDRLKEELLQDPATRDAYEARRPAYEIASKFIELRQRLGLSQRALAARAHMSQPEIARIEAGHVQPTWETISRILGAVGARVDIQAHDKHGKSFKVAVLPGPPTASRRS